MSSDAARGQKALETNDYPAAITHLTAAIKTTSKDSSSTISPLWLIQRSTAYQRTGAHDKALKDANFAHYSATQRGRRELIATSHFRRAVAYHGLGQFGNARMCLNWTHKYNEKEKGLTIWQAKVKADYDKAGGEEAECNKITCVEKPPMTEKEDIDDMFEKQAARESKGKEPVRNSTSGAATPATKAKEAAAPAPAAVAKPAGTTIDKIRVEWYQTNTNVTIEILCKGIPKENAAVTLEESQLKVKFPVPASGSDYEYNAVPLHEKIDAQKSSFRVTPHKVEITLVKLVPGLKWTEVYPAAAISAEPPVTTKEETPELKKYLQTTTGGTDIENLKPLEEGIRARANNEGLEPPKPTADVKKNWDKIVGDEDEDEGSDPMASFFQKLYKDADPDTRRAMMKSYQESNGTALSTSWGEVGSKTYETKPPDGMEAKKWE